MQKIDLELELEKLRESVINLRNVVETIETAPDGHRRSHEQINTLLENLTGEKGIGVINWIKLRYPQVVKPPPDNQPETATLPRHNLSKTAAMELASQLFLEAAHVLKNSGYDEPAIPLAKLLVRQLNSSEAARAVETIAKNARKDIEDATRTSAPTKQLIVTTTKRTGKNNEVKIYKHFRLQWSENGRLEGHSLSRQKVAALDPSTITITPEAEKLIEKLGIKMMPKYHT